jgi:hypothetical protein
LTHEARVIAVNHSRLGTVTPAVSQQTRDMSLEVGNAPSPEFDGFDEASPRDAFRCSVIVCLRSRQCDDALRGDVQEKEVQREYRHEGAMGDITAE